VPELCESERDRKRCAHGRAQDAPVSALTPDAISTATTGTPNDSINFDRTLRHALHFGVQSGPKIASITALGRQLDATVSSSDASLTSSTSPPRLRKSAWARAASPFNSAVRPSITARTPKPSRIRRRAATVRRHRCCPCRDDQHVGSRFRKSLDERVRDRFARARHQGVRRDAYFSVLRRSSSRLSAALRKDHRDSS